MASVTAPTTETTTPAQTQPAETSSNQPARSPWAFGGPFSHDRPMPIVAESATLGELDLHGRL